MKSNNFHNILELVQNQQIIDTHEHILPQDTAFRQGVDVLSFVKNSYAKLDFTSAGMDEQIWDSEDIELKVKGFQKYFPHVIHTEYVSNIRRSLIELYGIDIRDLTVDNYQQMSNIIEEKYKQKDWYKDVYRSKGRVSCGLLDTFWSIEKFTHDELLFKPVFRVDAFIKGKNFTSPYEKSSSIHSKLETIAENWQLEYETVDDVLNLLDEGFDRFYNANASAVKIAIAYHRSLSFDDISKRKAEISYNSRDDRKDYQDFIVHACIQRATELGLPIQIHTGLLARNKCDVRNLDSSLLNNLFIQYPDTKFVIFHYSYPYTDTAMVLAKTFPNVYIDLCWVPVISKHIASHVLERSIEMIPSNKIMWGGDAYRVEEAFGAIRCLEIVIAEVLAKRVDNSNMDLDEAKHIAQSILFENAKNLFNIRI